MGIGISSLYAQPDAPSAKQKGGQSPKALTTTRTITIVTTRFESRNRLLSIIFSPSLHHQKNIKYSQKKKKKNVRRSISPLSGGDPALPELYRRNHKAA